MHPAVPIIATVLSIGVGFVVAQTDVTLRSPETKQASTIEHFVTVPSEAKAILSKSCSDCHSNETHWPWYSYLPFIGSKVVTDVRKARSRMNLSDWPSLMREGSEETVGRVVGVCDEVQLENMPPHRYTMLHPETKLTPKDRKTLCAWSQSAEQELRQRLGLSQESAPR